MKFKSNYSKIFISFCLLVIIAGSIFSFITRNFLDGFLFFVLASYFFLIGILESKNKYWKFSLIGILTLIFIYRLVIAVQVSRM